jgi:hypothetical protein
MSLHISAVIYDAPSATFMPPVKEAAYSFPLSYAFSAALTFII